MKRKLNIYQEEVKRKDEKLLELRQELELEKERVGVLLAIIAMTIVTTIGGVIFIFYGDTTDAINTNQLGTILCNETGLQYTHREITNMIPEIHCKKPDTEILDRILVREETQKIGEERK